MANCLLTEVLLLDKTDKTSFTMLTRLFLNKTENAFQILDRYLYSFTKLLGFNEIQLPPGFSMV